MKKRRRVEFSKTLKTFIVEIGRGSWLDGPASCHLLHDFVLEDDSLKSTVIQAYVLPVST